MMFSALAPLLDRLSLRLDLQTAGSGKITLTVIPRLAKDAKAGTDNAELRPITLTGTPAELDEAFAAGETGALGRMLAARKTLSDQIAAQLAEDAAAAERTAAARKEQGNKARSRTPTGQTSPAVRSGQAAPESEDMDEDEAVSADAPVSAKPGKPAQLW